MEAECEVLVLVALPGVDPAGVQATIENGYLVIDGRRALLPELRFATIQRLELPQGRFHRRLPLPAGSYSSVLRVMADGCLVIKLEKVGHAR